MKRHKKINLIRMPSGQNCLFELPEEIQRKLERIEKVPDSLFELCVLLSGLSMKADDEGIDGGIRRIMHSLGSDLGGLREYLVDLRFLIETAMPAVKAAANRVGPPAYVKELEEA